MATALLKAIDILLPISGEITSDCDKRLDWVSGFSNKYIFENLEREYCMNGVFYKAPRYMLINVTDKNRVTSVNPRENAIYGAAFFESISKAAEHIENRANRGLKLPALYVFTGEGYMKKPYYVGNSKCKQIRIGGYTQPMDCLKGVGTEPFLTGCEKVYFGSDTSPKEILATLEDKDKIFVEIPDWWELHFCEGNKDMVECYDYHTIEQISDEAALLLYDGALNVRAVCGEYTLSYEIDYTKLDIECMTREEYKDYLKGFEEDFDELDFDDELFGSETEFFEALTAEDVAEMLEEAEENREAIEDVELRQKALRVRNLIRNLEDGNVEYDVENFEDRLREFKEYVKVRVEFGRLQNIMPHKLHNL